jgi:lysyl-tRNA synthetase class 2
MIMTTSQTITLTIAGITVTVTVATDGITVVPDAPVAANAPSVATATTRTPIADSSVIASVGYNVIHRTLEIEFRSGKVYQYDQVPAYVYDELMETRSKGQYFSYYIRGQYRTHEISR